MQRNLAIVCLVIDGLFESKEDGYYSFYLDGGDKETKLYLDHKLLINFTEDGAFGGDAIVPLSKGFYPFRIEYLCKSNTIRVILAISPDARHHGKPE